MVRAHGIGMLVAVVLWTMGPCGAAGAAENLLANGSFEDGLKGWESASAAVEEVQGWTPQGRRVARLAGEATNGGGWLRFTARTTPGAEYRLTVQIATPDFENCLLMATVNGTSPYDIVLSHQSKSKGKAGDPLVRGDWRRASGTFIAPGEKGVVQIGPARNWALAKAGAVWIDDVRLVATGAQATYGEHYEYRAVLPSQAAVGKPARLIVTGLCVSAGARYGIAVHLHRKLTVAADDPKAVLPAAVAFTPDKPAVASVEVTFHTPGVHRLTVTDAAGNKAVSNPVRVGVSPPPQRHYWGDIHIHTRYQHGSIKAGDEHDNYTYARDVAGLDFAALSEHNAPQITPEVWIGKLAAAANRCNEPGRFATLLGVESGTYQGHHNYYLQSGDPLDLHDRRERRTGTEEVLDYYAASGAKVLCIPHHTALLQPIDWLQADREHRRLLEVYSNHGSSEEPGPWWKAPLYRGPGNNYADSGSLAGHTWQDGLAMGRRVGVIGAGDGHSARPGLTGLACVLAPRLTREDIWDGMYARRCYATTGQRILMDFAVNEAGMGSETFVKAGAELKAHLRANACDAVERIEIVSEGKVVDAIDGQGTDMEATRSLGRFEGTGRYYYVRLTQKNGHRAWTSPVWVLPAGTPDLCVQRKDVSFDHSAGTLKVLARNYGDAAAEAVLSVHSDAADGQIARHEFQGRDNGVAVWVEPVNDTTAILRVVVASALRDEKRGEFTCSGTVAIRDARSCEVALDRRGALKDDGKGTLSWSGKYGMFFKGSQSRAGSVSPMAVRIDTTDKTTAEVAVTIDGKPCTNLWIGSSRAPAGAGVVRLGGIAARTRVATRTIRVPAGGGPAEVLIPGLEAPGAYLVVLDGDGKVNEIDERNNAYLMAVPEKPVVFNPWPEFRHEHTHEQKE